MTNDSAARLIESRSDAVLEKVSSFILGELDLPHANLAIDTRISQWGLIDLYRHLSGLTGGDPESMRCWLRSPCAGLENRIPAEMLAAEAGWPVVLAYLERCREGQGN